MKREQRWLRAMVWGVAGMLWLTGAATAAQGDAGDDATEESAEANPLAGHPIEPRPFTADSVQQALDQTEARQRAFYEQMAAKGRYKEALTHLGGALGRYGLNERLEAADKAIVTRYPAGLEQALQRARGPWYNFGKEARLYFLFSSRSKIHPGRMSVEAENVLLDKMWQWASTTARLEMTTPDRDWWSYGSENHWTHLWTGMWVTAQIFAEHPDYREKRYADGTTPAEMAKAWDAYARRWCRNRAAAGLLVEGNSNYNKQTLSGLYNVVDFAADPLVKESMQMWLDLFWADWAIEQIDGIRGGGRHRSYPGAHSTTVSSAGLIAWYHFGVGEPANSVHPDVWTAATTTYRPHPLVVELVLDAEGRGSYASVSRRPGLSDTALDAKGLKLASDPEHILAGNKLNFLDARGGGLLRYTWCTPDFILGTDMAEPRPQADWWNASAQNRWDGLTFGGHSTARIFVQAEPDTSRSFYNANSSIQSKGVLVVQRLKKELTSEASGQRIWFDQSLQREEKDGWVFARGPRAYAAVRVVQGGTEWRPDVPFNPAKGDRPGPGEYLYCLDPASPVILEAARASDYPSFSAFQQAILSNPLTWKNQRLDYRSNGYQTQVTLFADWSKLPAVDGVPISYTPQKVYDSPFIEGEYGRGIVTLRKGTMEVVLDLTKE